MADIKKYKYPRLGDSGVMGYHPYYEIVEMDLCEKHNQYFIDNTKLVYANHSTVFEKVKGIIE